MINFINALIFVLVTLFDLYIAAILLRVLLQFIRAPFHNPLCQFIVKITNPGFILLRKAIPGFYGIDFAGVIFAIIMAVLEIILITFLKFNTLPTLAGCMIGCIFIIIGSLLSIYLWSIIIMVICSFIAQTNPSAYNPLFELTYIISVPVLKPIKKMIPPIAGFDLSPLIACLVIAALRILLNVN